MSVYDNFADSPNQIKIEGQEITIKFQRTSDTTARISWNIPPPAHGCSADRQAYDGIVITIANTPANYITTSPKDGTYYDGDPTADYDLHSGSVIGGAYVVAALYHDKTTTFIDIDGIKPKTPYYVSGYAVDAVGRYHREGVHAYSLPTGIQSYATEDFPAKHEVYIYSVTPITLKSPTGLQPNTNYTLPIKIECKQQDYIINGSNARTYGQLVEEINRQFMLTGEVYSAPLAPNTGNYYRDANGMFSLWNGAKMLPANVLVSPRDPRVPLEGMYWVDGSGTLHVYTTLGWTIVAQVIASTEPPTALNAYDIWFDGTTVRVWEEGHWCDYVTIISDRNPQLPPDLKANDYWYNTVDNEIFKWNDILQKWDDALVIYFDQDPNTLNTGSFWYDEKNSKMKRFVGSTWNVVAGVLYANSDAEGNLPEIYDSQVAAGKYWFDTREHKFYQRNLLNTAWESIRFVSFPVNPRNRKSCDLWWNSSPSVDDLFVWEAVTSTWVPVGNFYRRDTDPSNAPLLDPNTAWVDGDGKIYLITPQACKSVNYINSPVNPRDIQDGMIWLRPDGTYFIYASGQWEPMTNIIRASADPFDTFEGMLWFDTVNEKLFKLVNGVWEVQCLFTDATIYPTTGQHWYNTVDGILLEWNGSAWVPSQPYIKAQFVQRPCLDEYEKIVFSTKKTGCHEAFEVASEGNTLFSSLANSVIYTDPLDGSDGADAGPMYLQLGVGDDGSPDERRALHEEIRMTFGYPTVRVELTKQQLDRCVDNALLMLRKHSTYSYKKGMFFMDLKSNQQVYKLTNRCVGFNKIVDILAIHRIKAGAFRTAYSQNDNFAFAALQQLYTLGTFDMLTFHLTSAYVEELETLFASRIMYQWLERKRELKIYQVPRSKERVLIEAIVERPEQELLTDRETAYWLKRWAIVEAKGMLAQIRGKFATLPGPNGTTTLNASDLQAQLEQERQNLIDEVQSKAMQDLTDIGMKAHFVMG